ncbi:MAG: DUF2220 domain-containing protein [bacterium]|nr:DUF2220 domain-containing protein [bacterium]MCM1376177.1 DUF2220 domain-containing protein [Muribaculum sp.]
MDKLQRKVLEHLLDSYERSKTFQGENQVSQHFTVNVGKLFPRYHDDAEYDYFCQVNEAMEELSRLSLVKLEYERKGILKKVCLNLERLDSCYELLERTPRKREQQELQKIWEEFYPGEDCSSALEQSAESARARLVPLHRYIAAQRARMEKNQNVEYYGHDLKEYRELLLAARAALENREEVFVRNLSMQLFHDSKRVEQLATRLEALLYQYGEFQEKGAVLEECGIVHTPTYVMIKGNGALTLGGQKLNLSLLKGDIALSTETVRSLTDVTVLGQRVVTVENLTSFHDYPAGQDLVIYLGGFHNKVKRDFLICLYRQNPDREYRHFGDIDAGGFYILEHLKRKTGIAFRSLHMDVPTLRRYAADLKPLTGNDRKRLQQLWEALQEQRQRGVCLEDYGEVIDYMLEHGCKLEQEAVRGFCSDNQNNRDAGE